MADNLTGRPSADGAHGEPGFTKVGRAGGVVLEDDELAAAAAAERAEADARRKAAMQAKHPYATAVINDPKMISAADRGVQQQGARGSRAAAARAAAAAACSRTCRPSSRPRR